MSVVFCPPGSDTSFGPAVNSHCRTVDFTLFFEDIFLACIPSSIFLILYLVRLPHLVKEPVKIEKWSRTIYTTITYILLLGVQLAFLAIRQTSLTLRTQASVASLILPAVTTCATAVLSYFEYSRSARPPILIDLYLFLTALFDIVRVRTFWLVSQSPTSPALFSVVLVLHILLLFIESSGKTQYLAPPYHDATREEASSIWALCLFTWVLPILRKGFTSVLSLEDIPLMGRSLRSEQLASRLQASWKQASQAKKNQLLVITFWTFKKEFFHAVVPRICVSGFTIVQPLLINAMIKFVASPDSEVVRSEGYCLIGAYAIVYIGLAISTALYFRGIYQFIICVRGGLITAIYQQIILGKSQDLGNTSAVTLMGTDVERISTGLRDVHELWASPLDIGLAVWLLERQLAVSCIVPVILSLGCILIITKVSKLKNQAQRSWIEKVELRIHVTAQILKDMKAIKQLGLAQRMESVISKYRSVEIETSRKFRSLIHWEVFISSFPWIVAPAASFALFTVISTTQHEGSLVPSQAFTALSLITLITMPVWTFIQALPAVVQCLGSFSRIQEYYLLGCSQLNTGMKLDSSCNTLTQSTQTPLHLDVTSSLIEKDTEPIISFRNASVKWTTSGDEVLHDIDLDVHKGDIIGIVGPVGSGKTTFLESILGETIIHQGNLIAPSVSIAYCCQVPWLINGSIRKNIIGPQEFQPHWYCHVIWMCGLSEDLNSLPLGDSTSIGTQGSNLSGGQKQRIALARAIYCQCELVILDDVFSGLDSVNIDKICKRLLSPERGYLRRRGATVLFTTHNRELVSLTNKVVMLDGGKAIINQHSLSLNSDPTGHFSQLDAEQEDEFEKELAFEIVKDESNTSSSSGNKSVQQKSSRLEGDRSVYIYYLKAAGPGLATVFFITIILFSFCNNFPTLWLRWWSNANSERQNQDAGMYLGVFIALTVGAVFIGAAASRVYLVNMMSNTAEILHRYLLHSLLGAPLSWFNETNSGDILNRFNQDLELTDMTLPLAAINGTKALGACLTKLAIIFAVAKYMSFTVPALVVICVVLQRCYLRTSRQIRLLSIEAKAPVYLHFLETTSGVSTIRSFHWQKYFEETNFALVDSSQKCAYALYMIQQWLTLAMDLLSVGLIVLLVILTVFLKSSFDPGSSGAALVTLMSFNQSLTRVLKFWSLAESCLGAISRIKTFTEQTPSEQNNKLSPVFDAQWPSQGSIEFHNVVAAYKSEPVLKSVSMRIEPGDKVAICGRSGSGKSSLLLCLGGLLPSQIGSIHVDGIDITKLSPFDILSRISIVPQEPCFLPGTIRFNIDPSEKVSDAAIERILDMTHLTELVTKVGGLKTRMDPGQWSAGQGQLIALARAVARKSKILILDEAMSRVDETTQSIMENVISTEFSDCTVLSVIHRYGDISRFDKIAVMENGVLVGFDRPDALLSRNSIFRALYTSKDA